MMTAVVPSRSVPTIDTMLLSPLEPYHSDSSAHDRLLSSFTQMLNNGSTVEQLSGFTSPNGSSVVDQVAQIFDHFVENVYLQLDTHFPSQAGSNSMLATGDTVVAGEFERVKSMVAHLISGASDVTAPSLRTMVHAAAWISGLRRWIHDQALDWHEPNITVGEGGRIVLEWWHDHKALGIYILGDEAFYIKEWGANIETEMEDDDADTLGTQGALWTWLMA